jgi:superoxide dismutase
MSAPFIDMQQLNSVHSQHHQTRLQNLNLPKADELQSQIKTALDSTPQ